MDEEYSTIFVNTSEFVRESSTRGRSTSHLWSIARKQHNQQTRLIWYVRQTFTGKTRVLKFRSPGAKIKSLVTCFFPNLLLNWILANIWYLIQTDSNAILVLNNLKLCCHGIPMLYCNCHNLNVCYFCRQQVERQRWRNVLQNVTGNYYRQLCNRLL